MTINQVVEGTPSNILGPRSTNQEEQRSGKDFMRIMSCHVTRHTDIGKLWRVQIVSTAELYTLMTLIFSYSQRTRQEECKDNARNECISVGLFQTLSNIICSSAWSGLHAEKRSTIFTHFWQNDRQPLTESFTIYRLNLPIRILIRISDLLYVKE